jgi:hypothetical protein
MNASQLLRGVSPLQVRQKFFRFFMLVNVVQTPLHHKKLPCVAFCEDLLILMKEVVYDY